MDQRMYGRGEKLEFKVSGQELISYLCYLQEHNPKVLLGIRIWMLLSSWQIVHNALGAILILVVLLPLAVAQRSIEIAAIAFVGSVVFGGLPIMIELVLRKRIKQPTGAPQLLPTQLLISKEGVSVIRMDSSDRRIKSSKLFAWDKVESFMRFHDALCIHFKKSRDWVLIPNSAFDTQAQLDEFIQVTESYLPS